MKSGRMTRASGGEKRQTSRTCNDLVENKPRSQHPCDEGRLERQHKATAAQSPSFVTASEIRSHIDLCIDAGPGGLYGRPFDSEAGLHRNVESARRCAFSSSAVAETVGGGGDKTGNETTHE